MRRTLSLIAALAAAALAAPMAQAQPQAKQTTFALIRCESPGDRYSECRADTQAGVRLIRELSRNRCVEGRSFGYNQRGIWVSGGCAAEFQIGRADAGYPGERPGGPRHPGSRPDDGGYPGHGPGRPGYPQPDEGYGHDIIATVECRSIKKNYERCPLPVGRDRVILQRRISKAACVQGQSWGFDHRSVWVDRGCRGAFAVVRVRQPQLLVCESIKERRHYCPANTVYGVKLNRQLSRAACIEGRTWWSDRNAIWVDQGCRAEFLVY
ncbi:MAG: DUF3011 domain-containing protein [Lysobacterales bacterium]